MEPRVHFYLDRAISKDRLRELDQKQRKEVEAIIKNRPLQIWASLTFLKYNRIKVYTGERITQYYWDADRQRINHLRYKFGAADFNKWLDHLENTIISEVRSKYRFNQTEGLTTDNLRALIKTIILTSREVQPDKDAPTVIALMEQFRDKYQQDWTVGYFKNVSSTIAHVRSFEQWRGSPLNQVEDYNDVWRKFKEYLVQKDINNSSANKHLKIFRRLLNHLHSSGSITRIVFKDLKPFKTIESFRIALKEEEVEVLAKYKFEHNYQSKARDLMLTQLFTGQRVSDLPQVLEQIKNGTQIHVFQKKGKKRLTIPTYPQLEKHLKAIVKKHPEGLEPISDGKYNEYIKECCRLAGITKVHTWVDLKGDKEVQCSEPRYNLVGSHTCRRTFATLADKKGISHKSIMAITGHTSYKVFLEYIRTDDEDVNVEFNEKMK